MPKLPFTELRDHYARSLAVVIPLRDSLYAAGGTALPRGDGDGKDGDHQPVARFARLSCSRTGVNAEPGDAAALGEAMQRVESGAVALEEVGMHNRQWIIENCTLDAFVARITEIMTEAN